MNHVISLDIKRSCALGYEQNEIPLCVISISFVNYSITTINQIPRTKNANTIFYKQPHLKLFLSIELDDRHASLCSDLIVFSIMVNDLSSNPYNEMMMTVGMRDFALVALSFDLQRMTRDASLPSRFGSIVVI